MNASESQTTHPQPCYLLDGVGAKPWGSIGEVCIATGHAVPASKQEKEFGLHHFQYMDTQGKKKSKTKVLKIPRISTEVIQ